MTLKTLVLYLGTTGLAISMALLLATWWQPGIGIEMQADLEFQPAEPVPLFDVLLNIFPSNPFAAMVEANMLQVIVFALLVGIAIRSEEHTSELQSRPHLVCRLLLEKKKYKNIV